MENLQFKTIKDVINGKISKKRAEEILCVSRRTIDRNIIKLKNEGKAGFIHKNWGKISNKSISYELEQLIINLRNQKYFDYNISHFKESLEEHHNLKISYTYLRVLLMKNDIYSPYMHKSTRKKLIQLFREKSLNEKLTKKEEKILKDKIISLEEYRPLQNRKEYFGERVQTDACSHNWIPEEKWSLHAFIDDATGRVLSGYFDYQETLFGYYTATKEMLVYLRKYLQIKEQFFIIRQKKKSLKKQTLIYSMPLCANNLELN